MNEKGFSLVELIVVITIFGVIAGLGIVNYNRSAGNYMTQTASEQLIQELRAARSAAISRNAVVRFLHVGGNIYAIQWTNAAGVVETIKGNIVFGNQPGDVNFNFVNLQGVNIVAFNNRGGLSNAQPGTIPSIDITRAGAQTITVRIQPNTGYIR